MTFLAIITTLFIGAILLAILIPRSLPRPVQPFFVQIDDDLDNIEWLVLMIIRNMPRKKIYLIDNSPGKYRQIINALAKRYHLTILDTVPKEQDLFYLKSTSTANDLQKHNQEKGQKQRSY